MRENKQNFQDRGRGEELKNVPIVKNFWTSVTLFVILQVLKTDLNRRRDEYIGEANRIKETVPAIKIADLNFSLGVNVTQFTVPFLFIAHWN